MIIGRWYLSSVRPSGTTSRSSRQSRTGALALEAVLALDPDVLITDISMPEMDGLQLAGQLKESHCRTKIIVLTMHQDSYFVAAALSLGVSGYVTKTLMSSDLVFAIEDAMKGNTFISGSTPQ